MRPRRRRRRRQGTGPGAADDRPRHRSPRSPPHRRRRQPARSTTARGASRRPPTATATSRRGRLAGGPGTPTRPTDHGCCAEAPHPESGAPPQPADRSAAEPPSATRPPPSGPGRRSRAAKKACRCVIRFATWNVNSLKVRLAARRAVARRSRARHRVHAGDQARRRRVPGADVRVAGLRVGPSRSGPVERRGDPVEGRSRRRRDELRDGHRPRRRRPDHHRHLRRHPRLVRVRAERPGARPRALPVQARLARPAGHARHVRRSAPTARSCVAGDFNIAPDDRDVYDPAKFVGATHVSEPERTRLRELADQGLVDVFRRHHDGSGVYSWWDYRAGDFHQGRGLRIDLILGQRTGRRARRVVRDRPQRPQGQASQRSRPVSSSTSRD